MNKKQRFHISKWMILTISILLNGFIIFYSCLDGPTTSKWNKFVTNIFAKMVNDATNKEVENIPLENIEIKLSNIEGYVYNYLPGYKVDEIPLGSAKQIECSFFPEDATNKTISYSVEPADAAVLNQTSSTLSVVGMKVGECIISAKSSEGDYTSSVKVKVVDTVAPQQYTISIDNNNIPLGKVGTINFDIDGGCLTHDELINFRYYDIRKLTYHSSNEAVATVDNNGVIYPVSTGLSTISVSNGIINRELPIEVISGSPTPDYTDLKISGSDVCYANDMLLDQNTKKNHYSLQIKDGETILDPKDFIWSSSNELLVKVDRYGVMRGFRKSSLDDEKAVITAKAKLTGQTTSFEVTVKNQLPTKMDYYLDVDGKRTWNKDEYTVFVGTKTQINVVYDTKLNVNDVFAETSDASIISTSIEGRLISLNIIKEGTCYIKFGSINNVNFVKTVRFTSIKAGSIDNNNIDDVGYSLRKGIGHAFVFMVTQIFTFITFYMFFYERKFYEYLSMSLGEGLFIALLSEFIQYFIPTRGGAWLDILIDFTGVVIGAGLAFVSIIIIKMIKRKKDSTLKEDEQKHE